MNRRAIFSEEPCHHLTVKQAAARIGHSAWWIREKIKAGQLQAFAHSRSDVTVSLESIVAYERSTALPYTPPDIEPFKP